MGSVGHAWQVMGELGCPVSLFPTPTPALLPEGVVGSLRTTLSPTQSSQSSQRGPITSVMALPVRGSWVPAPPDKLQPTPLTWAHLYHLAALGWASLTIEK